MKSFAGAFAAAVLLLAGASACGRDTPPSSIQELLIPVENDIQTLDPAVLSDPHTSRIVWQIYEGLVGLDENNDLQPMLAESWQSSDDFRTWTFRIRPAVRFHKHEAFGTPDSTRSVTAADVEYSFLRFAKGFGAFVFSGLVDGFDSYVAGTSSSISGFQAVDSVTFVVRLTRSDRAFLYRISSPYLGIMPREVVEASSDAFGRTVASGTGPFALGSRSDTDVRLIRNPDYWRTLRGNLRRVTFRVEKNAQFLATQLQNGTYGLAQLPLPFYPTFFDQGQLRPRYDATLSSYTQTTYNVHYVGIDVQQVRDSALRRSMAYAIDRSAIVERLLYGQAATASSPVLPGMLGYQPPPSVSYNPDSARALLGRSSYDGRPLTLLVSDAPYSEQIGEIVHSAFTAVGINITIERVDFNTLISRVFGGNRPHLFVLFSEWIFGAPEIVLGVYDSHKYPNPNMFGFSDPRVDGLLAHAEVAEPRAEVNTLLRRAESIALESPPALWLYHMKSVYVMDRRLTGFWVNSHNHWILGDAMWTSGRRGD
jgi:peptide/nickel transport system substrate-binding protein